MEFKIGDKVNISSYRKSLNNNIWTDGYLSGNRFDGIKENGFVKSIREVGKHDSEYYWYTVGWEDGSENVYKGNDLVLNISWYRDKKINNILNDL
jgi:hypothetical protein